MCHNTNVLRKRLAAGSLSFLRAATSATGKMPLGFGLLLLLPLAAVRRSWAFNVDTANAKVYPGDPKAFFGYKVLQYRSGDNKGILVTAPLHNNGSGTVCRADGSQPPRCFTPGAQGHPFDKDKGFQVKHLGLSIGEDLVNSQFTFCSPHVVQQCYGNAHLNSVCYNVTEDLRELSSFKPLFRECRKKTVDLVFLFDGSSSMREDEFEKNKDFIVDMMDRLGNTSIQFAAVQFASVHRTVFDFRDHVEGRARRKLRDEVHLTNLTNTYQALEFVWVNLFRNKSAGARAGATQVLVLITDGDPSDSEDDADMILETYRRQRIIRFVIGVRKENLTQVDIFASEPKEKYVFKIDNYTGLAGLLQNFERHIFQIEGDDKVARAQELTDQMSQRGLAAAFHRDTLILGSVGANGWRGALYQRRHQVESQIEDSQMHMDSYMGYSVAVGEVEQVPLYFAGAPRYRHVGQVVLFAPNGSRWDVTQRLNGEQIGSYFGAELCSVDVDSDQNSDFLLVGAPLYYRAREKSEGRIYVYALTRQRSLKSVGTVTHRSTGRFGASVASLPDLNGDGLRDVAVGAPLEDDRAGAVYIYFGHRRRGIRGLCGQRIAGRDVTDAVRFFGQAVHGWSDLGGPALPDVAVGARGAVVLLRSRPVVDVAARMSFQPAEIAVDQLDCRADADGAPPVLRLAVCFRLLEITKSQTGAQDLALNVSYALTVDHVRPSQRAFFRRGQGKRRSVLFSEELPAGDRCFSHSLYLLKCVKDTLSPISVRLNFSQVDGGGGGKAVLNQDGKTHAVAEVPFEKRCRKNDTCVAELRVDLNFTEATLVVAEDTYFEAIFSVANGGDDSYNSSVTMAYPAGLSLARIRQLEPKTTSSLLKCDDLEGVTDRTVCALSLPVYRASKTATFQSYFYVLADYPWNHTVSVSVGAESDNNNSSRSVTTKTLPVQFEIKMAITVREESSSYIKFTEGDRGGKRLSLVYQVDNPGRKTFAANVSVLLPTRLRHGFQVTAYGVSVRENKTRCRSRPTVDSEYCSAEKRCQIIACQPVALEKRSSTRFELSADVRFGDLEELVKNKAFLKRYSGDGGQVSFRSLISVVYDGRRYALDPRRGEGGATGRRETPGQKWTQVQVEFVILPEKEFIILTGSGLGLAILLLITLLMYKLGCFRRKGLQYYQEQEDQAIAIAVAGQNGGPSEDGPPEETGLLRGPRSEGAEGALE
ncbi:integrin alpha-L [Stigmatopora nigra]